MAERPRQTLTDYVAIAISPALIMALVGSLIFFLVEVAYAGAYGGEMRWMLFFFVFGIVLIARISLIGEIANRAGVYAAVLGLLVWFGLMKYVNYPPDSPVARARRSEFWPHRPGVVVRQPTRPRLHADRRPHAGG